MASRLSGLDSYSENIMDEKKYLNEGTSCGQSFRDEPDITTAQMQKKFIVQIQEPAVSDLRGYEVVKIEEKHGPFHSAIPVMPLPFAVIFCLLNLFLPGGGTLLSSPFCCCCSTRHSTKWKAFLYNVLAAFLQMLTFLVIVGWIWSIQWGIIMIKLARAPKRIDNGSLPYYVRRQSSLEQPIAAAT